MNLTLPLPRRKVIAIGSRAATRRPEPVRLSDESACVLRAATRGWQRASADHAASRSVGSGVPPAASRMSGESKSTSAAVRSARVALPANWCW